ncbi:MAG: LamG domain-containing protein [Patescibacteria group bacterium]|nr:LamG domain-containing protein [Patescibacteria group bacterium]
MASSSWKSNISSVGPSTLYSGLVGWWTFDGNSMKTDVADSSGHGDNGTISGMSLASAVTIGKIGQALSLSGSSAYVNVSPFPSAAHPLSVSAWVYPTSLSSGSFGGGVGGTIIDENEGGGTAGWIFGIRNNNTLWFWPSGGNDKFSSGTVPLDKWTYVTATYDGTDIRFYLNGVLDSTQAMSAPQGGATFFKLGAQSWITGWWKGALDDVRIYDRALSAEEIGQLYAMGNGGMVVNQSQKGGGGLGTGMLGWWTFDGKDLIKNASDSSGQGNDAYLEGFTSTSSAAVQGVSGQALSFDGTSRYILTPLTAPIGTGSYSMTAWFKTTTTQLAGIMSRRDNSGAPQFSISMSNAAQSGPGNLISIIDNDGSTDRAGASASSYADGKWHFVAIVRDSGTLTTLGYIDGALAITSNSTAIPDLIGTDNIIIGAAGNGGNTASYNFTGSIDDPRVYDTALSAADIAKLYKMGK